MARRIILGLDVGTSMVHTIVAEFPSEGTPRVLGIGIAPAAGIRRGVAIDLLEATNSIRASLEEALTEAKISPRAAYVAIGGAPLSIRAPRGGGGGFRAGGGNFRGGDQG